MALFGNDNYDRDYGNRGHQQGGGGMMDRAGNSIRRGIDNVRDRFDGDRGGWHGGARDGYGVENDESLRDTWNRTGYGNTGMSNTNNFGGGYGNTGGYGATGMGNTGWGTSGYGTGRNDYDRDFGARGGGMMGGQPMQHGWGGARESFNHNDYDRDFGGRGQSLGGGFGNTGYGNSGPSYGAGQNQNYDRDFGNRGTGYDRSNAGSMGYDRNMKSRTQTDTGDPFGDRANHTPIRMMRGRFERSGMGGGNPQMGAGGMGIDYDRQYKEGLGDDPYYNQNDLSSGGMYRGSQGGYDRNFRNNNDRGWF